MDDWQLRPVTPRDADSLHALAAKPLVFRYLFDGEAPGRTYIETRMMQAIANAGVHPGIGLWVLEAPDAPRSGYVELRPCPAIGWVELTYLLDPAHWGCGIATRMAWAAITRAFMSPTIDTVMAGADLPNVASLAVIRRLGMRYHHDVRYPLGAGVEYILNRRDRGPMPRPTPIRMI